jgi:hypothetical protein
MEPLSNPKTNQSQKELEWVKLVETLRGLIDGRIANVDAVIALFNAYSRSSKLSYSLMEDVIALEVIEDTDLDSHPYVAVIMTTRQGLRVRVDFKHFAEVEKITAELSITSLHQSDCYCS